MIKVQENFVRPLTAPPPNAPKAKTSYGGRHRAQPIATSSGVSVAWAAASAAVALRD